MAPRIAAESGLGSRKCDASPTFPPAAADDVVAVALERLRRAVEHAAAIWRCTTRLCIVVEEPGQDVVHAVRAAATAPRPA